MVILTFSDDFGTSYIFILYQVSLEQVENHIVGAPCGVMDQMTSACGEANKLLAMVCQVHIPKLG